jgi:hypothetical protein
VQINRHFITFSGFYIKDYTLTCHMELENSEKSIQSLEKSLWRVEIGACSRIHSGVVQKNDVFDEVALDFTN